MKMLFIIFKILSYPLIPITRILAGMENGNDFQVLFISVIMNTEREVFSKIYSNLLVFELANIWILRNGF